MYTRNRHYFARDGKFERRAYAFEKSVTVRIDNKITEAKNVLDAQYRQSQRMFGRRQRIAGSHATQMRRENQILERRLARSERSNQRLEDRLDELEHELYDHRSKMPCERPHKKPARTLEDRLAMEE
ncbi:hypothetical protein ACHAPU_001310 [Fusarium lateritium]